MGKIKFVFYILLLLIFFGFNNNIKQNIKTDINFSTKSSKALQSYKIQNVAKYANPIYGTSNNGNTYPGASAPFGMIQWSPDSGPTGMRKRKGGYKYSDSTIWGFSLDHMSGAGCTYGGNFSFMPILMEPESAPKSNTVFAEKFSHNNEIAKPGYYSVILNNGIRVELTTTLRSGFGRFTFPKDKKIVMAINTASAANGVSSSSIKINPTEQSISGAATGLCFCSHTGESTIYFYAVFNFPFKKYSTWSNNSLNNKRREGEGRASGAFITFDLSKGNTILVKTAISYVSEENAKLNIESESPLSNFTNRDFDKSTAAVENTWNLLLNKIQVSGGTKDEMETFYTMMYHAMLGPTICSDANGEYMGYDGKIHHVEKGRVQYANFSGWDIYRTECQFLAMIVPKRASDMAQSLLIDYRQGGTFPRWGVPNFDSGVMMGDPAAIMISDFYNFGAKNFDAKEALTGLVRAATDTSVYAPRSNTYERNALADYLKLGYVPEYQKGGYGNVSMTLEYVSADFALAQFAKALGYETNYYRLMKQSLNWKNLFNQETGFIQMRRRDGSWAPGFVPDQSVYDGDCAYVEGDAAQYVWMVPFDLKGLAEKMGGIDTAAKRLDYFFTKLISNNNSLYAHLANEPCLDTPWIYDFLNRPYKTQEVVRRCIRELFANKPAAYPGNDDLGTMSAWYIFATLGIYPELPGSAVLVLGSPLFPKAVIHLKEGDVTIIGKGARENASFVQSLKVNKKTWNKPWINFSDISGGGEMIYKLNSTPNKSWGNKLKDAPPSYN